MDLGELEAIAANELRKHGLIGWTFAFSNARRRLGACKYRAKRIEIAEFHALNNPPESVLDTLLHEVAHAIAGPPPSTDGLEGGRGPIGATPRACDNSPETVVTPGDWQATCPACEMTFRRYRRPRSPSGYRCRCPAHSPLVFEFAGDPARRPVETVTAEQSANWEAECAGCGTIHLRLRRPKAGVWRCKCPRRCEIACGPDRVDKLPKFDTPRWHAASCSAGQEAVPMTRRAGRAIIPPHGCQANMLPHLLILPFLAGTPPPTDLSASPKIEDGFGRSLEGRDRGRGVVLVDWEGQIANPAARFDVLPPPDARYPGRVVVRSDQPRLYFDLPSTAGPGGPRKEIRLDRPEKTPVLVAIFPDRDALDEDHALEVEFFDPGGERRAVRIEVHVVDQDRDRPGSFPIAVDFSRDRTGFFADGSRRSAVVRAAEDWAYFLDGAGLDPVPAGAEATAIWNPDGFNAARRVDNERAYAGFLLYAYGIDGPLLRSGGEPSTLGGFQSRGGAALPIRRSGGYEAEIKGNYNRKGWLAGLGDADWWRATNGRDSEADLESIAHHEIGHALVFNPANTLFGASKRAATLRDDRVRAYLGSDPAIDPADHLAGAVDPASLRGGFGNEYHGAMPNGRWLITKLDLLCAGAVGHRLRETSPFAPLDLLTRTLPDGAGSKAYSAVFRASGGIPAYCWDVVAGALPDGLTLDSFTGELRGIPRIAGPYEFTVRVRDSDRGGITRTRRLVLVIAG